MVPAQDAGAAIFPTVCAADDAGVDDEDAAVPRECVVVGDLHLQYKAADTNATDNQIKPHFNVVNHGARAVDLKELTIRYWYSDASTADLAFWCDYAQIDCGNVRGAFAASDPAKANRYLELSFTGGSVAAGMQTGEIQARFNKVDWTNFDETDDYSFDPSKTAFADWYKVTLYRRGTLVWGAEPH
jgi:endoglucanase